MDRPVDQPESPFEILRRLENLARVGTVEEVRTTKPARVRIRTGDMVTNWLPWVAGRAGGDAGAMWWPPVKGEQVMLLAPGGDLNNAMAMPGAFSDKNPQGSERADIFNMVIGGGASIQHDAEIGALRIEAVASIHLSCTGAEITMTENRITLKAGGATMTLSDAGLTVSPDVTAQGVSLASHVHSGVDRGGAETDGPR